MVTPAIHRTLLRISLLLPPSCSLLNPSISGFNYAYRKNSQPQGTNNLVATGSPAPNKAKPAGTPGPTSNLGTPAGGTKPGTPAPAGGTKPATPAPGASTKPATPAPAPGTKPATPAPASTKPGTPVNGAGGKATEGAEGEDLQVEAGNGKSVLFYVVQFCLHFALNGIKAMV